MGAGGTTTKEGIETAVGAGGLETELVGAGETTANEGIETAVGGRLKSGQLGV